MKHATSKSLARIDTLLERLRSLDVLKEKTPGVFYWLSKAFLHFHEDDDSIYADVRLDGVDFERFCVDTKTSQDRLLAAIRRRLSAIG